MDKENDDHIYRAWRKFEAYQIPMTEQGEMSAHLRWHAFKTGWLEALKEKSVEEWHQEWVPDTENPWKEEKDNG